MSESWVPALTCTLRPTLQCSAFGQQARQGEVSAGPPEGASGRQHCPQRSPQDCGARELQHRRGSVLPRTSRKATPSEFEGPSGPGQNFQGQLLPGCCEHAEGSTGAPEQRCTLPALGGCAAGRLPRPGQGEFSTLHA